jgi:hypothetical protein
LRNPFSRVPDASTFCSPPGSRTKIQYEGRFNGKHGTLVATGTIDTQDIINAYAPLTDINYMLHRLSVGDRSVLSVRAPMYGDFSGLPSNPVDAINMVENARSTFGRLPVEEKQKFNNDYRVWLAGLFSGSVSPEHGGHDPAHGAIPDPVKEE